MKCNLVEATECDKTFFWEHYCHAMRFHIEQIWGWDEKWQLSDFETRWGDCDNKLICMNGVTVGYIQIKNNSEAHYLMMLILLPEYRSKGLGAQLLAQIKSQATLKCIGLSVFRTNLKALGFYKAQGFTCVEDKGDFYCLEWKAR